MIDIMEIIGKVISGILDFVAMAFKEGWLYYIIGGLIVLTILVMFFS